MKIWRRSYNIPPPPLDKSDPRWPGHDRRYAIDASKIERELNWKPEESFETGMRKTIEWYLSNDQWIEAVTGAAYQEWVATNYADRKGQTEIR